jgi:hypothetical protein
LYCDYKNSVVRWMYSEKRTKFWKMTCIKVKKKQLLINHQRRICKCCTVVCVCVCVYVQYYIILIQQDSEYIYLILWWQIHYFHQTGITSVSYLTYHNKGIRNYDSHRGRYKDWSYRIRHCTLVCLYTHINFKTTCYLHLHSRNEPIGET